ncbi:MAG TPA: flagellar biosynthetic protein FliR [Bryobacteraceae bacterium]|nr:flagellar biosynthetic protein FliR [Bryobacteraceae bacterium]
MPSDVAFPIPLLLGFLLTLVRVSGVFVFVPIPGISSALSPARVILSIGTTLALFAQWPRPATDPSAVSFVTWILMEAALGVGTGLAVAFAVEAFGIGTQILGLQAGFAFASTVDPNTQADSTVLVVLSQVATGLLFFAMGLDREVLRILARSLETYPAGSFTLSRAAGEQMLRAGATMFSTGLRLAMPLIAILVMLDIALALLGRVNGQLQLLHLSFPLKMMVAMGMLGLLVTMLPELLRLTAAETFAAARGLIAH